MNTWIALFNLSSFNLFQFILFPDQLKLAGYLPVEQGIRTWTISSTNQANPLLLRISMLRGQTLFYIFIRYCILQIKRKGPTRRRATWSTTTILPTSKSNSYNDTRSRLVESDRTEPAAAEPGRFVRPLPSLPMMNWSSYSLSRITKHLYPQWRSLISDFRRTRGSTLLLQ